MAKCWHCQCLQDHSCVCWLSVAFENAVEGQTVNWSTIPYGLCSSQLSSNADADAMEGIIQFQRVEGAGMGCHLSRSTFAPLSISMAIRKQEQWLTSLKRKTSMHSWKTVACSCEWPLLLGHQKILGRGCMRTYAQCLQWLIISVLEMCFHLRTGRPLGQRSLVESI